MKAYHQLEEIFEKIHLIGDISNLLSWDKDVLMPSGSHASRTKQLCFLESTSHDLITSPKTKDLLEEASNLNLDKWQKRNLFLMHRAYNHETSIDKKLKEKFTIASSNCEMIWRTSKKNNDYKSLLPSFKEVINLTREIATIKSEIFKCSKYDALLDLYDPGRKSSELDLIFTNLAAFLQEKIPKIIDFQKINLIAFEARYPIEKQKNLGLFCMKKLGFDINRGRLDISSHPFCGGTSEDIRMTTRYQENEFLSSLAGIVHETGHAIYEQNLPKEYLSQEVGRNLGMSAHESQSLLVEMQLFRSKKFTKWLEKAVFDEFGEKKAHSAENIYNHLNEVRYSKIRVDADEVTYPLHVIMRYNLEKKIIDGEIEAEEIPHFWNAESERLLHIKPKNDSEGCMQDIHWPLGSFGYFPCYSLGAIIAAQFFSKIRKSFKNLDEEIERGEFKNIFSWLRENVHNSGSLIPIDELLEKTTGKRIDIECYKSYILDKYLSKE